MEQKTISQRLDFHDMATLFSSFGFRVVLLGAIFLAIVQDSTAQAFMTRTGHAEFKSRVPFFSFTGVSDDLVGVINLADSTVDFYLDLTTLKTGIGKRDKDMRLTLETKEYPFAEFYGKIVSLFYRDSEKSQVIQVNGTFTIHGVSREITVTASLQRQGEDLYASASWKLNLNDYNIKPPRLLMVKVDEIQELGVTGRLNPVSN
ncbi:MAG: hypothetical protein BMS9Abin05_2722 [Rhodothermia bacterium]|nr:MAG: hypothetical protein BMS9Abin05_2722 [Rhodothermia bacterium]